MYKQMNNLLDGTLCSNEIIAVEKQTLISNRVLWFLFFFDLSQIIFD